MALKIIIFIVIVNVMATYLMNNVLSFSVLVKNNY